MRLIPNPVEQEVNGTVILPPLVFPGLIIPGRGFKSTLCCNLWKRGKEKNINMLSTFQVEPSVFYVSFKGSINCWNGFVFKLIEKNSDPKLK